MQKKSRFTYLGILLLLLGVGILLYPPIKKWLYQVEADRIIEEFDEEVRGDYSHNKTDGNKPENTDDNPDYEALYRALQKYNRHLYETGQKDLVDPFSYEQVGFSLKAYGFEEDMIGYLEIPGMGIRLPVYLGASNENMGKGGALLTQTSIPIGGENTNGVIAAHRGWTTAPMFQDIERLRVGDIFTLTNFRETLTYRVDEIKVIEPTDIEKVLIQPGRDMITLITCHPAGKNYQRYAVYAVRSD